MNSILVSPDQKSLLKKELIIFTILAALISWPLILLVVDEIMHGFPTGNRKALEELFGSIVPLYGTGPLISAVITTWVFRKSEGLKVLLKRIVEWRVSVRWYVLAVTLPLIPQWAALGVWKLLGHDVELPPFSNFFFSWIQIALFSAAYYVTEELGWRGFMLPRFLSIHKWIPASLITGLIWSVWHYPLWIASTWATTGSIKEAMLMVIASSVFATGISVFVTRIFINTKGSVLFAMILHGSSQANLTKMYAAAGDTALMSSGFIMTQATVMLIAVGLFLLFAKTDDPKILMKSTGL